MGLYGNSPYVYKMQGDWASSRVKEESISIKCAAHLANLVLESNVFQFDAKVYSKEVGNIYRYIR